MFRRCAMVLGVLPLLLSVIAGNAWGVVRYTVTDLGVLPGYTNMSFPQAINNKGQVVGYSFDQQYNAHGFLWENGKGMQDIGTLGGTDCIANDINDNGQIVGTSVNGIDGQNHAYIRQSNGQMQDIFNTYGVNSNGNGINNSGQVVGANVSNAFLWNNGGTPQLLGSWTATSINNNGQVAGWGSNSAGTGYDAFFWQSGSGLRDIGGLPGSLYTYATRINDIGQVVGYSEAVGWTHAFLWEDGKGMQDLGALGGNQSTANDINNLGQVVGTVQPYGAFLWQDGLGMVDLNTLIPQSFGGHLSSADAINDNGWIVCTGSNEHVLLLTPTPEPSTLALLGIGAISLLACAWRRRRV